MTTWEVQHWLSEDVVAEIEYSSYWNDETAEQEKPFNILDGEFGKLERYLDDVGLVEDVRACLTALPRPLSGNGIDLAAGTLWAAPLLLDAGPVERLYCLEYSKHRLLTLGPRVLEHYQVAPERIVLVYGSFYQLHLDAESLDFAFLSQAFHHAERPRALLAELRRVLKPGGTVIMVGEHILRPRSYVRYTVRATASLALPRATQHRVFGQELDVPLSLRPKATDVAPTDTVLGDHSYSARDYRALFSEAGFTVRRLRRSRAQYQSFILTKG